MTIRPGAVSEPSIKDLTLQLARAVAERDELRAQQAATGEVLEVIGRSGSDIQPVLNTIVTSAARLCAADACAMIVKRDGRFSYQAFHGGTPEFQRKLATLEVVPGRTSIAERTLLDAQVIHVEDLHADPDYGQPDILRSPIRTALGVPLLHDGEPVGVINLMRFRVEPFTKLHIELVRTFADQAAMAYENARLFTATKEALEQQTATSNVLKEISHSTFDLTKVLQSLLDSAMHLGKATSGGLFLPDSDGGYRMAVLAGEGSPGNRADLALEKTLRDRPIRPGRDTTTGLALLEQRTVHTPDINAMPGYRPDIVAVGSYRTNLAVPMLRDGAVVGVIVLTRGGAVLPFTDKQIEMVETFAAQAVIAIENVRLFDRTREALEQQTATANVLQVINASPGDLAPVFDAIVENSMRLCEADGGGLWLVTSDAARPYGHHIGNWEKFKEYLGEETVPLRFLLGDDNLDETFVHVDDMTSRPAYKKGVPFFVASADLIGLRTVLCVPVRESGSVVAVFSLWRNKVRPFADRQIELVRSFAAQAQIAMKNARLMNETREALERQTATAEILKVIASSPTNVQPVFDAIAERARLLCDAQVGSATRFDGEWLHMLSYRGASPQAEAEMRAAFPVKPGHGSVNARAIVTAAPAQVPDIRLDPNYQLAGPVAQAGLRSMLGVPMVQNGRVIGVIGLGREAPGPYSDNSIALLQTFADQAVIAVENVRLFNETREALERQTATSDILRVISDSPTDVTPVFDAIAERARVLCGAVLGFTTRFDGELLHLVGFHGTSPEAEAAMRAAFPVKPSPESLNGRCLLAGAPVQISDIQDDPQYRLKNVGEAAGYRSGLAIPLLQGTRTIGIIGVAREEVGEFPQKMIEVLKTFASQAVIAIGNVGLFNEVTAKSRDLGEALQQQTATADVLKVISRRAFDLQAVFDTLISSAVDLCGAFNGTICLRDGDAYHYIATSGIEGDFRKFLREHPPTPGRASAAGRVLMSGKVEIISDALEDADYVVPAFGLNNTRSVLGVPLLRNDRVEGVLVLARVEPGLFTDRQIELVQTFADQAVIAIENARLLTELRKSLERQTATSDILQVISRSPTDVQPVFDAIVRSAVPLCNGLHALFYRYDGALQHLVAQYFGGDDRDSEEGLSMLRALYPRAPQRSTATGTALLDEVVVHVADLQGDARFSGGGHRVALAAGYQSSLAVPLLKEGHAIGVIYVVRRETGPFAPEQIALLESFAAQAVIAIENVRLFTELRDSLERLKAAQTSLIQAEKLASLGQLTAGIAHEIKNPLNFINNFADLSAELVGELREALDPARTELGADARADVDELTEMLSANLGKVSQHGRRADSIVKNMLLHSREGSGERRRVDLNASVEESLNLAYHGARAEKPGFNMTLEKNLDPALGEVELYPQEFVRVLLNLISNGFYAAHQRKIDSADAAFEPTLRVTTRALGDQVEIRIRDNGTGIPDEVKEKIFNPFFTTKPAGEGTGLGLSLSFDIVVKQHGGTIDIQTEPGAFTEFIVTVPRQLATGGTPTAAPSP